MKDYGSKKKKRRAEFEARKFKREQKKEEMQTLNRIMRDKDSTIEDMAKAVKIPLK